MPLTDGQLQETIEAVRLTKRSDLKSLSTGDGTKVCDFLARNLEVQIEILATLDRIEEKLK